MDTTTQDILNNVILARRQYHESGESFLSDDEYDALVAELKAREVVVDSRDDGIDVTTRVVLVKHRIEMPSTPFAPKSLQEFENIASGEQHYSLKYDGLAIELQYVKGVLMTGSLRGDGFKGEEVTRNIRAVWGVQNSIRKECPHQVDSVYGELVVSYNNLKVINEYRASSGQREYSSPRSAVNLIRKTTTSTRETSLLTFRPYAVLLSDGRFLRGLEAERALHTMYNQSWHPSQRFNPVKNVVNTTAEAWRVTRGLSDKRNGFKYQLDGMVSISVDSGVMVKLKFDSEAAVSTVIDVIERTANSGIISPVATFEPIQLLGARVSKASVHNFEYITSRLNGLGPGAKVLVSRRGDVIPHVEMVVSPSPNPWTPSSKCPSCEAPVLVEGSVRRCSADPSDCPGTATGLILKFCAAVGIDGIGAGVASELAKYIDSPASLFVMELDTLSGMTMNGTTLGKARAEAILSSIEKVRVMDWATLLGAIGIKGCAGSTAEKLAERFTDAMSLYSATVLELAETIGPARAEAVYQFIKTRWWVIEEMLEVVTIKRRQVDGPLAGKTFCITLALNYGSRPEFEAKLKSLGGATRSSVTRDVTHVVCNTPNEATSKLIKARELGVPIISEQDIINMAGPAWSESATDSSLAPSDAEF